MKTPISEQLKSYTKLELREFFGNLLAIHNCCPKDEADISQAAFKILMLVLCELVERKDKQYLDAIAGLMGGKLKIENNKLVKVQN